MSAGIVSVQAANFAGLPINVQFLSSNGDATGLTGVLAALTQPATLYPAPPSPLPSVILAGNTYMSGAVPQIGFRSLAISFQSDQTGIMTLSRYIDAGGAAKIAPDIEQALTADVLGTIIVNDGIPFGSFVLSVNIPGGTNANITNAFMLQGG